MPRKASATTTTGGDQLPTAPAPAPAAPVRRRKSSGPHNTANNYIAANDIQIDDAVSPLITAIMHWPAVDLHDADAVQQRIDAYFSLCQANSIRPGVVGMASSLGIDRRRLWDIRTGSGTACKGGMYNVPPDVVDCLKKAYTALEALWEYSMQSGKINPPCGIFLGKNHYGYQDVVDYTITPRQDVSQLPADQLQRRLDALPDD